MPVSVRRPPEWTVEESSWEPHRNAVWESRATLANGYLAVRGYPEEPFPAGPTHRSILLGLPAEAGGTAAVSDVLAVEITLDGQAVLLAPGRVISYRRTLDMMGGLLQRQVHYHVSGRTSALAFERFASLSNPHVLAQSVTITPMDWAGSASIWFWFDPGAAAQGGVPMRLLQASRIGRERVLLATQTEQTRMRIVHAGRCSGWVRQSTPPLPCLVSDGCRIALRYDVHLECSQRAVFERVVATYTSTDPEVTSAERSALEEVRGNTGPEYGTRRRNHLRTWRRRWEHHDIVLRGPLRDQRAIRFAIFHLVQACPPSARSGAGPSRGPAHGALPLVGSAADALILVPFLSATDPAAARDLLGRLSRQALEGRTTSVEAAATPADLIPPAWYYLRSSGDTSFRGRWFLPLLRSAARTGMAAPPRPGGNALLAAWTLRLAAREHASLHGVTGPRRIADGSRVTAAERSRWLARARELVPPASRAASSAVPPPEKTLALSALVPGAVPKWMLRHLVDRWLPTRDERDGSARLPALLAIACCDLGSVDRALEWLRACFATEIDDDRRNAGTDLRYATLADAWLALTRGFAGMHAKRDPVRMPQRLPREWEGLGMTIQEPQGPCRIWLGHDGFRSVPACAPDAVQPRAARQPREVPRGDTWGLRSMGRRV
jgi:hypothetical protein